MKCLLLLLLLWSIELEMHNYTAITHFASTDWLPVCVRNLESILDVEAMVDFISTNTSEP